MDSILRFDRELFIYLNNRLTSPFLDSLMPYVTEKMNFLGVVIVAAALIWILGKRQDRIGLVVLVAVVAASDLLSDGLKHVFMRMRPCNAIDTARLLVGCSSSYSFPSGHATNIFASMVFLTMRYKKFFPVFLSIALIVAYSRVYVGVHYPLDITGGAILGSAIAAAFFYGEKRITAYYLSKRGSVEV